MTLVLLLIRILLAGTFGVAGVGKLFDREGSRTAVRAFGAPPFAVPAIALLLPIAELACAVALLTAPLAIWGAWGSLALLVLFVVVIVASLARGVRPNCHCFGQIQSSPIGWGTVVRNVVLGLFASLVIFQGPGLTILGGVARVANSGWALLALAMLAVALGILAGWAIVHLLRMNGRLLLRLEAAEARLGIKVNPDAPGLSIGVLPPAFRLQFEDRSLTGEMLRTSRTPALVLFVAQNCGACDALLPELAEWQTTYADRLSFPVVARGEIDAVQSKFKDVAIRDVFPTPDREIEEMFRVTGTPAAVLIRDGLIASHVVLGADGIREVVEKVALPKPLSQGDRLPAALLSDLEGRRLDLRTVAGRRSVLVFWSGSCGFCQAMIPDLKAWEASQPKDAPVVFIASGSIEANRAAGLSSRLLLDPRFAVSRSLGAEATPSAMVIDEGGRLASQIVVGAPNVWEMIRGLDADVVAKRLA